MKAKHLRIGNIVTINNDSWVEFKGVPLIVTGIGDKMDTYNYFPKSTESVNAETLDRKNDFAQFDEFIEPIPLTEDWLLKFGFDKFSSVQYDRDDFWAIQFQEWGKDKGSYYCNHLEITIKYVYQLQNHYFALYGEELELK